MFNPRSAQVLELGSFHDLLEVDMGYILLFRDGILDKVGIYTLYCKLVFAGHCTSKASVSAHCYPGCLSRVIRGTYMRSSPIVESFCSTKHTSRMVWLFKYFIYTKWMCENYTIRLKIKDRVKLDLNNHWLNDSGVIEHITVPSLSSASFACKQCTGSVLVISFSTSSIPGMLLWNASEALSKKITSKDMKECITLKSEKLIPNYQTSSLKRLYAISEVNEDEHNITVPWRGRQEGAIETRSDSGHSAGNCTQVATSNSIRRSGKKMFIVCSDSGCHWMTKLSQNASWNWEGVRKFSLKY